ncbi:hypothetical protein OAG60_02445, partial [bacterium]|nr:hypothetical protein [bacterium]
ERRIGFHGLRRTFATVAHQLSASDRTIREVMAHAHRDVLHSSYIEGVDRDATKKLCEGVRVWLYHHNDYTILQQIRSGEDLESLGNWSAVEEIEKSILNKHPCLR